MDNMKPAQVISELTYSCYKFNRETFPETTSEQWAAIFGNKTDALEARFTAETTRRRMSVSYESQLERQSGCYDA